MAEVIVGFVSAGVGIAAFALQISKSIDTLRQMRLKPGEARKDLTTLLERLEILHQAVSLLKAWEGYQPVDAIIQHVQQRYGNIEQTLRDLLEKVQEKGEGYRGHWKRAQSMLARHPKQQIGDLRQDINDLISILNLAFLAAQCQLPTTQELTPTAKKDAFPPGAQDGDAQHPENEEDAGETKTCTNTAMNPSPKLHNSHQEHRIILPAARASPKACRTQKHDCACHLDGISGRFWFLQYTPLSRFIEKPNGRASGCNCINLRLRLALSLYGVPIAIVAGIGFMVDGSGFNLRPALRVERIVNYTSPGFETIWRLENRLISLPEAQTRFIELYRSDSSVGYHRDPAGNSYIQTLLRSPWIPWGRGPDDQLGLLHTLVTECDMSLADETQSFLVQCAHWNGRGSHLTLLDAILEHGFDATAIHASPFEDWPCPWYSDRLMSKGAPDPFFIEYVNTILAYSPRSTTLHNVLLNESVASVELWLHRSQPIENNVNFMGQTPLHIVTTRPELCRLVLDAGHDLDVTDKLGATPLMYAAAMGQTGIVKLLISRGANPGLTDTRLQWTFLDYAFERRHWNLALDALLIIQTMVESSNFQDLVRYALVQVISHFGFSKECITFLQRVIELSDDTNFTFGGGDVEDNNLMHYARTLEMASTLVRCGFNNFNQKNSKGRLAINSLAERSNAPLVQFCLERGTDVGNVSHNGRTIFFDILPRLDSLNWTTWEIIDSVKLCLRAGADPFITDDCICPCSPDGCHVSAIFELDFSSDEPFISTPDLVWSFELLTLLEEYCGVQATEQMLLSLLRRFQCDQPHTSIAHVCCHRGRGIGWERLKPLLPRLESEDIEEMLDDERDFITTLEMDMGQFTSFGFSKLRSEFMAHFKGNLDAHIESTKRVRDECAADSEFQSRTRYEADYKADEYVQTVSSLRPIAYSIAQSMAEYAFWLQHESLRADKPLIPDFHKAGWFERRVSWFLELMGVMEVTVEMLREKMESIRVKKTRTESIDHAETVKSFLKALEEASNKD